MLTKIEVENFKCFQEKTAFPLGKLTLLTGINGCGKSTLLQSLLLMRQSISYNENTVQILLNGECLNLNSFKDIRNNNASRNDDIILKYFFEIEYYIYENYLQATFIRSLDNEGEKVFQIEGDIEYYLNEKIDDDRVGEIKAIKLSTDMQIERGYENSDESLNDSIKGLYTSIYDKISPSNKFIVDYETYTSNHQNSVRRKSGQPVKLNNLIPTSDLTIWNISRKLKGYAFVKGALKFGHLDFLEDALKFGHIHYISADRIGPQDYYPKFNLSKFINVGARGQFTVNLLSTKRDDLVNDKLCLGQDAKTLATQTEEWMSKIFNGAKVEVPRSESNMLELLLNTSTSKDRFRPANVGYGYHCTLPIIVSGLIAKEGEILIVENPEAHLHPRAQSELAKFLAKVSNLGVQVFIESHSDHILNGLRIAVLDNILTAEELSVLYFKKDPDQPFIQIPVQSNGGIEEWPEGFFDQMDQDFSRLFGM
jgi:predicted ATPase